ncbi:MAG: sigma-54-dependent Fis family transcriptional regulator, partial [Pirellulaceae bacterium]|nr:sigma-54-dependent Fis family transcriptional regulator [Pirellulaceae bacterium]
EALDQESLVSAPPAVAVPLAAGVSSEVLVVSGAAAANSPNWVDSLRYLAGQLHGALSALRYRLQNLRRIQRLEAILEIAAAWRQTLEMDDLLVQIAEASTRLLEAERASIFLWDRPNRSLIARPALGVEGGELRIPDDTGIVGQVIHSETARRVNEGEDQREIDRQVDQQLAFRTRSLLCVPLRTVGGRLLGAFEMINKREGSFTDEDELALTELAAHAALALENTQQYEQLLRTRNQMAQQAAGAVQLIGQCPAIEALKSTIRRVADTELAILILGENGTGKEVVAQQIHYLSRRRNESLIAVNCAALTETLLESELFGHEKGAFTDAREMRQGKFELASGGTLFLDEIGDMSLGGQAKLLRVLEEKVVVRVGGSVPIHTDARVLAATNQNLAEMVRQKKFREDLYYRLNVVNLDLPPLRSRGEDIVLLAEHFLRDFSLKARRKPPRFTAQAVKRLVGHSWPGNVRELRNLMERLAYLTPEDKIDAGDLAFILSPDKEPSGLMPLDLPLTDATRVFQVDYIRRQIAAARGNMTEAAERMGLHRSNLYRKMRQLDMEGAEE